MIDLHACVYLNEWETYNNSPTLSEMKKLLKLLPIEQKNQFVILFSENKILIDENAFFRWRDNFLTTTKKITKLLDNKN